MENFVTSASLNGDAELLSFLYGLIFKKWANHEFYSLDSPNRDLSNYLVTPYVPMGEIQQRKIFKQFKNWIITYNGEKYRLLEDKLIPYKEEDIIDDVIPDIIKKYNDKILDDDELNKLLDTINGLLTQDYPEDLKNKLRDILKDILHKNTEGSFKSEWVKIERFEKRYNQIIHKEFSFLDYLGDDTIVLFNDTNVDRITLMLGIHSQMIKLKNDIVKSGVKSYYLYNILNKVDYVIEDSEAIIAKYMYHFQRYCIEKNPTLQKDLSLLIDRYLLQYTYILENKLIKDEYLKKLEENHNDVMDVITKKNLLLNEIRFSNDALEKILEKVNKDITKLIEESELPTKIEDLYNQLEKHLNIKRELYIAYQTHYALANTWNKRDLNITLERLKTASEQIHEIMNSAGFPEDNLTTVKGILIDLMIKYSTDKKLVLSLLGSKFEDKIVDITNLINDDASKFTIEELVGDLRKLKLIIQIMDKTYGKIGRIVIEVLTQVISNKNTKGGNQ